MRLAPSLRSIASSGLLVALCLSSSTAIAQSDEDLVEIALLELVESAISWPDALFTLSNTRIVGELPSGDWHLDLAEPSHFRDRVRARVISDAASDRAIWVMADIAVELPVVVAARAVPSRARLEGHTAIEMRSLSSLPRGFITEEDALEGMVTRRALRAGDPVRASFLERPILFPRNQVVAIIVRRGHVVATDRGLALEPGRQGELIRVRSLSSDEVLSAIVLAAGRVEVP